MRGRVSGFGSRFGRVASGVPDPPCGGGGGDRSIPAALAGTGRRSETGLAGISKPSSRCKDRRVAVGPVHSTNSWSHVASAAPRWKG